jgi:hypothetical protein
MTANLVGSSQMSLGAGKRARNLIYKYLPSATIFYFASVLS